MSTRLMISLSEFTPSLEVYSINESFLDLSSFSHLDLTDYGHQIRQAIKQWTGLPIAVGIGPSKTLAKIANRIAKKSPDANGVFNLLTTDPAPLLAQIDVEDVWGVGRRYANALREKDIETALQLRDAPQGWVKQRFGVTLLRTVLELGGFSCIPLELAPAPKQGITCSRSFGRRVQSLDELKEAIATHTSRAAEKLRREQLVATVITVFIHTNRLKCEPQHHKSVQITLPVATDDTAELIHFALRGLASIYRSGHAYQKAGVMLLNLVPFDLIQPNLFDRRDRDRSRLLMATLDQINQQMGKNTLQFAAAGLIKPWQTRSSKRSPRYTTQWSELPVVQAKN
jgi:DNA polymerase V